MKVRSCWKTLFCETHQIERNDNGMTTFSFKEEEFNDTNPPINDKVYEFLLENDVDTRLARHLAHLFIRDPLVIYDNEIQLDEQSRSDHFENIQSTNWQTVRFKPPPPKSPIGWRVEFRYEIHLSQQ